MRRLAFMLGLRKASTLMRPRKEIDGEGGFAVGEEIPAESVEGVVFDVGEAEALPGEACGLPGDTFGVPGEDGVEAGEEDEVVCGDWSDFGYGLHGDVDAVFGV